MTIDQVFLVLTVIVYIGLLLATVWLVRVTKEYSNHTKELARQQKKESEPNVLAFFDVPYGTPQMYLIVKNIGKGIAKNVKLEFQPPLIDSHEKLLDEVLFLTKGIPTMPPGYEMRTFIGMTHEYFSNEELPKEYNVKITYYCERQLKRKEIGYVLDLSCFYGLRYLRADEMSKIIQKIHAILHPEPK
jgi:hypothetical protein